MALAAAALVLLPSTPPASADGVAGAEASLETARSARIAAEGRLAELEADHAAALARLEMLEAGAAQLTTDIAEARRAVRELAVAAYIDGGQGALLASTLTPEERAAVAWRGHILGGRTVTATAAVDHFMALKEANDPERIAAAAELDDLASRVSQARNDAIQAAAHERDAESALARARSDQQARQAAARRAAAQRDAAQPDTTAAATAAASAPAPSAPSGTPAPAPAPSSRPAPSPAPAPSTGATSGVQGDPTASESATLARIRQCESGGNYSIVSSSGRYRGAYQFDYRTWQSVGGSGDPAAASPAEQDYRALLLFRQRGHRPWPNCA